MTGWCSPVAYQRPITPVYASGAIVIESDDGTANVYVRWFPICRKLAIAHNQWSNLNAVSLCPNVNTATINSAGRMTSAQLVELAANGWEIMSHGKTHTGLGAFTLTAEAAAGQKIITLDNVGYLGATAGYTYKIVDGETIEEITIASIDSVGKTITTDNNLVNTYGIGANVSLTDASMETLLQGCIDDLAVWGITCENHVYSYHSGSQHQYNAEAVAKVGTIFNSARGVSGDYNTPATNKFLMKSRLMNGAALTDATIDTILDHTLANDEVTIFYGHGETSALTLHQLEYLIEGAFTRGIRILTRADALARLV